MTEAFTMPMLIQYLYTLHNLHLPDYNMQAFEQACVKLNGISNFVTKLAFQWLPTAAKLHQQDANHNPNCPQCQATTKTQSPYPAMQP